MDRTESYNANCGPIGSEVKSALYTAGSTAKVLNYVYGLGGRDVTVESLGSVFADLQKVVETGDLGEPYRYLSVKE